MEDDGSLSRIPGLVVCKECRHVAKDEDRHKQHMMEARHIHAFRNSAYRYSKDYIFIKDFFAI